MRKGRRRRAKRCTHKNDDLPSGVLCGSLLLLHYTLLPLLLAILSCIVQKKEWEVELSCKNEVVQ
jgi:hypothetical protein